MSCIFFTYQWDTLVKLGKKASKTSLKNCCSLRIKLSSVLYGCATHVWEEVVFIETSSTAVTCFYFQNLNKNCWINMLLQRLWLSVLPIHWVFTVGAFVVMGFKSSREFLESAEKLDGLSLEGGENGSLLCGRSICVTAFYYFVSFGTWYCALLILSRSLGRMINAKLGFRPFVIGTCSIYCST